MADLALGIAACAATGLEPRTIDGPAVPLMLRRRVSPIGQAALRAAWSLPSDRPPRLVFASRNGEIDRTLTMLRQLAEGDGPSPADFSLGVHNALAGLLSVVTRNRGGHTALAAGIDSFGFGLMEAAASLIEQPDEPVMLVYYDAPLPPGYPDTIQAPQQAALALALLLVPPTIAPRHVVMTATPLRTPETAEAAATVFLRFLQTGAPAASAAGERMRWDWRHV
jgi:hypothetical protein